jgi:hypothetical protein
MDQRKDMPVTANTEGHILVRWGGAGQQSLEFLQL